MGSSRRKFLKQTATIAAAGFLNMNVESNMYAAGGIVEIGQASSEQGGWYSRPMR
jgi:hypothetical protein